MSADFMGEVERAVAFITFSPDDFGIICFPHDGAAERREAEHASILSYLVLLLIVADKRTTMRGVFKGMMMHAKPEIVERINHWLSAGAASHQSPYTREFLFGLVTPASGAGVPS